MQPLGIRAYPLPTDIIDLARRIDQVDDVAKEYIEGAHGRATTPPA